MANTSFPKAFAHVDGKIIPLQEAKVSALDRGFLFGDAVYEVLWVHKGKQWLKEGHYNRLDRSLKLVRIHGVDLNALDQKVQQTIEFGNFQDAIVYIQITRGSALRAHAFPKDAKPFEFLYVQEFKDPYSDMRTNGIGLLSRVDIRWDHCDIKSTNLLANVLAIQDAKEAGCHEVLFHLKDGTITESAHSSLFGVLDGIIYTSPTSEWILPGITRDHILSVCAKEGIPLREKSLHLDQLEKVSELFITGTTCGVLPVATLDGKKIGNGKPGPVAQRVSDAYWKTVKEWANSESPEKGIGL